MLVLLHGRGADERDLFTIARVLPDELVVASVRAPHEEGPGYAWFAPRPPSEPEPDAAAIDAGVAAVLDWLDGLHLSGPVGLLGFSQGAALALQLLRSRPTAFAAVVQLSGFLLLRALPGDAVLERRRPPVFWGRGLDDLVISPERVARTAAWLPSHATLTERAYPGGHVISEAELGDVAAFLGAHLI